MILVCKKLIFWCGAQYKALLPSELECSEAFSPCMFFARCFLFGLLAGEVAELQYLAFQKQTEGFLPKIIARSLFKMKAESSKAISVCQKQFCL